MKRLGALFLLFLAGCAEVEEFIFVDDFCGGGYAVGPPDFSRPAVAGSPASLVVPAGHQQPAQTSEPEVIGPPR